MRDIVGRLRSNAAALSKTGVLGQRPAMLEAAAEILSLRQQVEKARAMGRDEGLEEAAKAVCDYPLYLGDSHYRKVLERDERIATAIRALKSGEGV